MLVVQGPLDIIDRCIRHSTAFEDIQPFFRGLLLRCVLNQAVDISAVFDTVTVGDKSRVGTPFGESKAIAEHTKESIVAASEKNVTVEGLVAPVWYNGCYEALLVSSKLGMSFSRFELTMSSTPATRIFLSTDQCRASQVCESSDLTVTQASVDMLALTCPDSRKQCSHDSIGGVESGSQVGDCHSNLHGRAISRPRNVHQSHLRLYHDIVASSVTVRSRLAIAGDTRIDQFRINLPEGLVVHVIFLQCAWKVVLNEDIAFLCKLVKDLNTRLVLER